MKSLHLIRHAKSSWGNLELSDIDRPLNQHGREACRIMARPIWDAGCDFAHVFCSVATRAQMTIAGIVEALPTQDIQWRVDDGLYTFSAQSLIAWVRNLDDALEDVVIVGHNPATTGFINAVSDAQIKNVSTCGYAQLSLPINSWQKLGPSSGHLVTFLTPSMIG